MPNEKKVHLLRPKKLGIVSPEIYGHFSEHIGGVFYDGLWVGRDSAVPNIRGFRREIIEKMQAIHAPVLRWPGGCFAEVYDWRDGIGEKRPVRPNWWTPRDHRYESNAVGTHEFMELCEAMGAKPYFAANMTSTTPQDIRDWMDYCLSPRGATTLALEREKNGHPEPFDIPFWGVGNENWGGGGHMRPEHCADLYRQYAMLMSNVSKNHEFYVCGSNAADYSWTHGIMQNLSTARCPLNGFTMHYYCGKAGDPVAFSESEWTELLVKAQRMEEIILRNWSIIMAYGLSERCRLIVDEWGCWHPDGSGPSRGYNLFEQQSTMRDAMVTALTLNIFNRHCDKVRMANVAQLVNNLHCLFLASGEHCITTPTYHVFDMYKEHQGGTAIDTAVENNEDFASSVSVSATVKNGRTHVTLANLSCREDARITLAVAGETPPHAAEAVLLHAGDMHAHNTFEHPDAVVPEKLCIDPTKPFTLPKAGIMALTF